MFRSLALVLLCLLAPRVVRADCRVSSTNSDGSIRYVQCDRGSIKGKKGQPASVTVGTVGPTIRYVPAGGDLRAALMASVGGDVIELQAGATYPPILLPVHAGDVDVTIRTRGTIPDRRVTPADQPIMATIASTVASVPAMETAPGAHHWRLEGVAVTQTGGQTYDLIRLGDGEDPDPSHMPHHITLDRIRCFVSDTMEQRRCLAANANDWSLTRSDVRNIKEAGSDSQAVFSRQGERGVIVDNYLEAAGENVLFGGADPGVKGAVPSDLRIEGNTIVKPDAWRTERWQIKNLLELKNARRVTIRRNVFRGTWLQAQAGYAILFTPRGSPAGCPWCIVEDVLFEQNRVEDVSSAVNLLGIDTEGQSLRMSKVTIRNNLFRVDAAKNGGEGRCYMIGDGPQSVTIDHNTCVADGGAMLLLYGQSTSDLVFTNNLARHNSYGVIGAGTGIGTVALTTFAPGSMFRNNVLAGGEGQAYPESTLLPSLADFGVQFTAYPTDLSLVPGSPWKAAGTDGKDLGADLALLP